MVVVVLNIKYSLRHEKLPATICHEENPTSGSDGGVVVVFQAWHAANNLATWHGSGLPKMEVEEGEPSCMRKGKASLLKRHVPL